MIKVTREVAPGNLIKFQLFDAEDDRGKPHYDWVKAHQLTFNQAKELFDYGASIGQEVFFSVFAPRFVDWCERIGVKRYKIASTYKRDPVELDAVIKTGKPILMSLPDDTVGVDVTPRQLDDMEGRVDWLYCPPGYPPPRLVVPYFKGGDCPWQGYSDHNIGILAAKIALARGAGIIEKHFMLESNNEFPDCGWSMVPAQLAELAAWEKMCREILN